jgi:hypothetical protein
MIFIFLDNIWRQARITVPPLLGLSTYKILVVGIIGSKPTGGKICFEKTLHVLYFLMNTLFIRFGY